jgi:VCBS repeat-containing protein
LNLEIIRRKAMSNSQDDTNNPSSDNSPHGHTPSFPPPSGPPVVVSESIFGAGIFPGGFDDFQGPFGLLTANDTGVIKIGLSQPVMVADGIPSLSLNDGGGTATYDAAKSTSTCLVFDYNIAPGQYATPLAVTGYNPNGATVTNGAGTAADFSGADKTFSHVVVDATTPVASPDNGSDTLGNAVSVSPTNGVLANDSDANPADFLHVAGVNGSPWDVGVPVAGTYGTLILHLNGSYTYINTDPGAVTAAGGSAEDTFNYMVGNGHGGQSTSTLTIEITSPGQTVNGGHSVAQNLAALVSELQAAAANDFAGHGADGTAESHAMGLHAQNFHFDV